ncbi:endothelin-converting enzyme-like 1 [Ornithodoros turicata]|uniref:endothelin-converting enzyme-like 1 n=1 Tax=Ornithodoros turicata TaxID=34597 RepID=UPI0031398B37
MLSASETRLFRSKLLHLLDNWMLANRGIVFLLIFVGIACVSFLTVVIYTSPIRILGGFRRERSSGMQRSYFASLTASMNKSQDPCKDFYNYVCGNFEKTHEGVLSTLALAEKYVIREARKALQTAPFPPKQVTAEEKIEAGLKLCYNVNSHRKEEMHVVTEFLQEAGLNIPITKKDPSLPNPLYVFMWLSLKAGIPLLVNFQPFVDLRNRNNVIYTIAEARTIPDEFNYELNLFKAAKRMGNRRFAEEVDFVSSTVRHYLGLRGTPKPTYAPFSSIEAVTPNISLGTWLTAINRNLRIHIGGRTEVYFCDTIGAKVVNKVMSSPYDIVAVLNWIGFIIHYYLASASSRTLQDMFERTPNKCMRYMTRLAPYAVAARISRRAVSKDSEEIIRHLYRQMLKVVPNFFKWLDPTSRAAAIERFQHIRVIFGVPDQLRSPLALDRYYDFLPKFEAPFVRSMINAFRAKALKASRMRDVVNGPPRMLAADWEHAEPKANFEYWKTMMTVHMPSIMFNIPVAEPSSLAAMYGALGTITGHELSHAHGTEVVRRTYTGSSEGWWTPDGENAYNERLKCIIRKYNVRGMVGRKNYTMDTLDENLSDIGGLQLVLAAAKADGCHALDGESPVPGLTNKQLFFVSSCNKFCVRKEVIAYNVWKYTHARYDHRCNIMPQSTRDFYEAFNCPVDERALCEFY